MHGEYYDFDIENIIPSVTVAEGNAIKLTLNPEMSRNPEYFRYKLGILFHAAIPDLALPMYPVNHEGFQYMYRCFSFFGERGESHNYLPETVAEFQYLIDTIGNSEDNSLVLTPLLGIEGEKDYLEFSITLRDPLDMQFNAFKVRPPLIEHYSLTF